MARKFKIGNKVRVKKRIGKDPFDCGWKKGMVGVVSDYCPGVYPYTVSHKKYPDCGFTPAELELV